MKKLVSGFIALLFVFAAVECFADASIPNLVGTWTVKSEAAFMSKGNTPGKWTHHTKPVSDTTGEMVFAKQEGRRLYGTFKTQRATESFVAIIGMDNKTVYMADQDGFTDAKIVDNDTMHVMYRHVTDADAVVVAGVMKRKK
jgi:hypothetical protein